MRYYIVYYNFKLLISSDETLRIIMIELHLQETGRSDRKPRVTFIFYTTKKVTEPRGGMALGIYTAEYPKCINYCPRCIEMMRRIETLFRNSPSDRETDFCELFSCPPCTDIVHKFSKFTAEDDLLKQHDSELIHLQRLMSPSEEDAFGKARTKFEDLVKVGVSKGTDAGMIQDSVQMKKEKAEDKDLKTKTTKVSKSLDKEAGGTKKDKDQNKKETAHDKEPKTNKVKDKDLKTKSTVVQKTLGKGSKDKANGDYNSRNKLVSSSKFGKSSPDSKTTVRGQKEKNDKHDVDSTHGKGDKAQKWTCDGKPMIREKINELIKQKAQQERALRAHEQDLHKHRKDIDDKLIQSAKLAEEASRARAQAEEERQMKFRAALMLAGPQIEEPESEDRRTVVCSDDPFDDHMIKGDRICKASKEVRKEKQLALPPITVRSTEVLPPPPTPNVDDIPPTKHQHDMPRKISKISYLLSERKYVDNGWTQLPKEMVMRRVTLFHMHPVRNDFDWLEMNRHKGRVLYDSGEQLATFDENGRARVYYRSGVLALDFYQAEDELAGGYRVVVYSKGNPVERGRAPLPTVLAVFDYSGNGAVFDHTGQPRLKYTQNDGVVLDRSIGPYTHWKWHNFNNLGRLQTVLIENEPRHKDQEIIRLADAQSVKDDKSSRKGVNGSGNLRPGSRGDKSSNKAVRQGEKSVQQATSGEKSVIIQERETLESLSNDETIMRNIETQNVIKENRLKRFSPYQIKMKAFKINENFSLRIIDQSSVFLTFTDGKTRLRLNVGMIMDPTMVLGQELVEVGEVASSIEKLPASESVEQLQRVVRGARDAERARVLREHRLNPPVSSALSLVKDRRRTK